MSEWGRDFRPLYLELGNFREKFASVPFTCATAVASPSGITLYFEHLSKSFCYLHTNTHTHI